MIMMMMIFQVDAISSNGTPDNVNSNPKPISEVAASVFVMFKSH